MKSTALAIAAVIGVAVSGAPAVQASDVANGLVPSFEIINTVRSIGLTPIEPPFLRGRAYVLRALDRQDDPVRVVVDARTGEIIRVVPILRPRIGMMRPPEDEFVPVPPRAVPGGYDQPPAYGQPPIYGRPASPPIYGGPAGYDRSPGYQPPYDNPAMRPPPAGATRAMPERPAVAARTPMPRARPTVASAAPSAAPKDNASIAPSVPGPTAAIVPTTPGKSIPAPVAGHAVSAAAAAAAAEPETTSSIKATPPAPPTTPTVLVPPAPLD